MNPSKQPAHRARLSLKQVLMKPIRAVAVASAAGALVVGGIIAAPLAAQASAAPVITGPDSNGYCYTSTPITQNEYVKVIKGQHHDAVTHVETRWSKTTIVYTIEHKDVKYTGNNAGFIAWLNSVGTAQGNGVWTLSDDVVNAAKVNPLAPGIYYDGPFSSSHTVAASAYGGPQGLILQYRITGVDISFTPPKGSFVKSSSPVTVYYVPGGSPSASLTDANWTKDTPAGWTKVDTRTVTDHAAYDDPDSLVFYLPGGGQDSIKPNADKSVDDPHWTTDAMPSGWTLYATRDSSTKTKVTCPPAKPEKCVITDSVWKAEPGDIPATLENDGYHFDAATTPTSAQDIYQRATGNMQGVTDTMADYGNVHGFAALVVVEVSPNEVIPGGTSSSYSTYATISSASPVVNGVNNVQDGLWYTSRIQYGQPGGQGHPITWQQMIALMPNNTLLSAPSLHKQTNATTSDTSTVKSLSSSCGSFNFVTTVDGAKPTATITSSCVATAPGTTIPANSEVKVTLSNPYTKTPNHVGTPAEFRISVDGGVAKDVGTIQPGGADVTITSAQDSELSFPAGSGKHTVVVKSNQLGAIANATVNADDCDVAVTPVAPTPPVNNVCTDGKLVKGHVETFAELQAAQPEGVIATLSSDGHTGTFAADKGFTLASGSATKFDLGTVGGPTTCTALLALTGQNGVLVGLDLGTSLALVLLVLVAGGALIAWNIIRRRRGNATL